jgi:predicted Zn finger-like uncharacterized protein
MRFSCENCQAKYQVADDKVAGKTIRMKCRKCGNSIEVKPVQAPEANDLAAELGVTEQHPIAPPPETRLGDGIAARSLASPSFPRPEGSPPSRLPFDSSPGFDRAPESLRLALGAEAAELPAHFWYVAIGGAPVGPIALAEVVAKAHEGLINDRSLAWREGLAEWQPVGHLPELVEAIGPALHPAPPACSVGFPAAPPTVIPERAPVHEPVVEAAPPAPAAPSPVRKEFADNATLAATPISNELRALLDSSPAIVKPPVVEAPAPARVAVSETAPFPRDPFEASPASARVAPPPRSKAGLVAGVLVGLVVGFVAGRLSAPVPAAPAEASRASVLSTPVAPSADEKLEEVPTPPAATGGANAPAKSAPRGAPAPAPRAAASAPAEVPVAARPVTASAPPPPPMPSFGGGGASLTEGQIAAVLSQRKVQLRRACWERIENHEAAVKVLATIAIDGTGRVSSVDAQGTDAAVTACIRQQIKEWPFPATGAPTTATLPFSFVSQ